MKKLKRAFLAVLCLGVVFGTVACGTDNGNVNDDAANNTTTEQNDGGVVEDIGDTTGEVIDDIGNGVENVTDDVTRNNGR